MSFDEGIDRVDKMSSSESCPTEEESVVIRDPLSGEGIQCIFEPNGGVGFPQCLDGVCSFEFVLALLILLPRSSLSIELDLIALIGSSGDGGEVAGSVPDVVAMGLA